MPTSASIAIEPSVALSVVVLSYGAPATLVDAVSSLLAQRPAPEVVVVNSGGGDAARLLRESAACAGADIMVIEDSGRLMPGGARNRGIEAARGRYVAFLADDCRAEPGWVEARLAAHARGAAAVASALVCDRPRHPVALAAHLSLFVNRMPATHPDHALRYGASYDRQLFEAHGVFRDDLRTGEDTEFHQRLSERERPVWAPDVRTIHRSPTQLSAFLADQHARGRRTAMAWRAIDGRSAASVARAVAGRVGMIWARAPRAVGGGAVLSLVAALPLVACGACAYALGALRAPHAPPGR